MNIDWKVTNTGQLVRRWYDIESNTKWILLTGTEQFQELNFRTHGRWQSTLGTKIFEQKKWAQKKRKIGGKMALAWKVEEREGRGFCLFANKSLLPGLAMMTIFPILQWWWWNWCHLWQFRHRWFDFVWEDALHNRRDRVLWWWWIVMTNLTLMILTQVS